LVDFTRTFLPATPDVRELHQCIPRVFVVLTCMFYGIAVMWWSQLKFVDVVEASKSDRTVR
jgi:hypothetical protein